MYEEQSFNLNKSIQQKYMSLCSKEMAKKYGYGEYTGDNIISMCDDALSFYCNQLSVICSNIHAFDFFKGLISMSIQMFHLSISKIYNNNKRYDFAITRRTLKLILGELCKNDFFDDYKMNEKESIDLFDALKTIGERIFYFSQGISTIYMLGSDNIKFVISKDECTYLITDILTYHTFKHISNVSFDKGMKTSLPMPEDFIPTFIKSIQDSFGQTATDLGIDSSIDDYDIISIKDQYELLLSKGLNSFSDGLILKRNNIPDIKTLVLKPGNLYRCRYRPFLSITLNGNEEIITTKSLIHECFDELFSNCFPWGIFPLEWDNKKFKSSIRDVMNMPMNWLEDKTENYLTDNHYIFLRNVKGVNGIAIDKPAIKENNVGEIDFIFVDSANSILYVVDCKNNKTRYEMSSWTDDKSHFMNIKNPPKGYNYKLESKLLWISSHIQDVEKEFGRKYHNLSIDLSIYVVKAFFIVDTPTFYMYDSPFRIIPFYKLDNALSNKLCQHEDIQFSNQICRIEYPLFDNIKKGQYTYNNG